MKAREITISNGSGNEVPIQINGTNILDVYNGDGDSVTTDLYANGFLEIKIGIIKNEK